MASTALSSPARGAETTGDIAEWLEDKYHVMEVFYQEHESEIADDMAESVADQVESLILGAPIEADPYAAGMEKIKERFHEFLYLREIERAGIPGVPTLAAQRGVNHRLAHPYARGNSPRPSFIDTGLYEANFQAWMDQS